MTDLEALVDTLLYEGYALYPYTPGATKNATPTPFGIAYPPVYAARERRDVRPRADRVPGRRLGGVGDRAVPDRGGRAADRPRRAWARRRSTSTGWSAGAGLELAGGRMALWVANETDVPEGLDRAAVLPHSLLSTHLVARVAGGRFTSPLEAKGCEQINAWPVLASRDDDVVLGAAIMLPDHPQIAPESRGSLFDSTEIEEALLLHVMALSDDEREETARQDPAVRQMLERAARTTPEDLMALHGRVTVKDPEQGESEATVDGVTYRPGRPGAAAARAGAQRAGPPGHGPRRGDRAHLRGLRRPRAARGHDRRRAGAGPDARHPAVPFLPTRRGGGARAMSPEFEKQILVAGVGNAWLQDDGFGPEVVRRLEAREMPSGVTVMDFGSGGLDLAYEIMRGYDALVLVDVSRQGGEPGTLYVLEPDPADYARPIEDGETISPHGMDPQTVLRFVNAVGGFSGKVVVVACEPGPIEDLSVGLSPEVEGVLERALEVVQEQVEELRTDAAYGR